MVVTAASEKFDLWTITSAFRPGDDGVHGTVEKLRGIDLRCHDLFVGQRVAGWVNANWEYDPERPHMKVCICHDVGKGVHLHFQVCENTRRKT